MTDQSIFRSIAQFYSQSIFDFIRFHVCAALWVLEREIVIESGGVTHLAANCTLHISKCLQLAEDIVAA